MSRLIDDEAGWAEEEEDDEEDDEEEDAGEDTFLEGALAIDDAVPFDTGIAISSAVLDNVCWRHEEEKYLKIEHNVT